MFQGTEGQRLKREMVFFEVDVDVPENKELQRRYRARRLPTTLVLSADGKELGRLVGYRNAQSWLKRLRSLRRSLPTPEPDIPEI